MKLIIFDFDGVLVDTLMMHYEISKEADENMSLDTFLSISNRNIFDSLKDHPTIKRHPKFFERYEEESRKLEMPQLLKDFIHKLSKDYKLAIVSSTPSTLVTKILKQVNAFEYFSDILGNDINTSKVIKNKMLLNKYGIIPEKTIYITDTIGDIIEARECAIKSIAVTWGYHKKEALSREKPFALVDTPQELEEKIEEFFK